MGKIMKSVFSIRLCLFNTSYETHLLFTENLKNWSVEFRSKVLQEKISSKLFSLGSCMANIHDFEFFSFSLVSHVIDCKESVQGAHDLLTLRGEKSIRK